MYCRNCGNKVDEKAVACSACGVPPLCERKFCQSCGVATQTNQVICVKCGVSLANNAPINAAPPQDEAARKEKTGYVIGVVSICIGALACGWSVFGGMCCNWGAWPLAFIAIILAIVSLVFRGGKAGWWGLALGIGAIVLYFVMVAATVGANQYQMHFKKNLMGGI